MENILNEIDIEICEIGSEIIHLNSINMMTIDWLEFGAENDMRMEQTFRAILNLTAEKLSAINDKLLNISKILTFPLKQA